MSDAERAATRYRSGGTYPEPPSNLVQPGKRAWRSLVTSRPVEAWTPTALTLLVHYIETDLAAARVARQLPREKDLADPRAVTLTRELVALNASASMLLVRLRLTPQAAISRRAEGYNTERGYSHPLIGGHAVEGGNGRVQ